MPSHQYSIDLITHHVAQSPIQQRAGDGYINATQLCSAAGKRWYNYLRVETTGHFLRALEEKTQISSARLVQEEGVDVWVHPKVAIHLAQWLSADFAVQVSEWVYDWVNGKKQRGGELPYHLRRHMANLAAVPPTHFSILQEMTMTLIGPLEAHGYTLPEQMVPDISQGLMFAKFARDELRIDTQSLPTYEHRYEGRRPVQAKLYPIEVLGAFRKFVNEVWMPQRAAEYFRERDPQALPFLDKVLMLSYQAPRPVSRLPAPRKRA